MLHDWQVVVAADVIEHRCVPEEASAPPVFLTQKFRIGKPLPQHAMPDSGMQVDRRAQISMNIVLLCVPLGVDQKQVIVLDDEWEMPKECAMGLRNFADKLDQ